MNLSSQYPALLFAVGLTSFPIQADLYRGVEAYRAKNYTAALPDLMRSAELGSSIAQYAVGDILLTGALGNQDSVGGCGWLLAAQDNGLAIKEIISKRCGALDELQRTQTQSYVVRFGRDAISRDHGLPKSNGLNLPLIQGASLGPGSLSSLDVLNRIFALPGRFPWEFLSCIVDAEGRIRDVFAIEPDYSEELDAVVTGATRLIKTKPAQASGKPISSWFTFLTKQDQLISRLEGDLKRGSDFKKLLTAAQEDAAAQFILFRFSTFMPKMVPTGDQEPNWLKRSAEQNYYPIAMYSMDRTDRAVQQTQDSFAEERTWLHKAAQAGFGPAQMKMALFSWAEGTPQGYVRASRWLSAAHASQYPPAAKYMAALLIAHPADPVPDANQALALATELSTRKPFSSDADLWQVIAAAHAVVDNYPKALEAQQMAVKLAKRYSWETQPFEKRLNNYRQKQKTSEEILVIPPLAQMLPYQGPTAHR